MCTRGLQSIKCDLKNNRELNLVPFFFKRHLNCTYYNMEVLYFNISRIDIEHLQYINIFRQRTTKR